MRFLNLALIITIIFLFAGCAGKNQSLKLELLDRPPPFTGCEYTGNPKGHWCVNDDCYIREIQQQIMLNHTITRYEIMIIEYLEAQP